jgi:hypothetical protein
MRTSGLTWKDDRVVPPEAADSAVTEEVDDARRFSDGASAATGLSAREQHERRYERSDAQKAGHKNYDVLVRGWSAAFVPGAQGSGGLRPAARL